MNVEPTEPASSSPAPSVLPAVLEGFDLTDQARFAQGFPHQLFARLRKEAPVLLHPGIHTSDGEPFWVVSRYADVRAAAADASISSQGGGRHPHGGTHIDDARPELPGVLINMMDDPRHASYRRLLSPAMGRQALALLEGPLREHARELVRELFARGGGDFASDIAAKLGGHAIALLLGVPRPDWPMFVGWTEALMGFDDRQAAKPTPRSQEIHMSLFHYGAKLLAARRNAPAADLTSLLANGQLAAGSGEPPLTELERQTCFCLMALAGTESTRNLMAGGVLALLERPVQWQLLRGERALVRGAVEESLRWTTPTPYNRRTATRDVQLGGVTVREGDKITLWWASANRDEAVFADAGAFEVRRSLERKEPPHLACGHGTHDCFGEHLGKLEMQVLLETLLEEPRALALAGPVTWAPSNKHTVVMQMPVAVAAG